MSPYLTLLLTELYTVVWYCEICWFITTTSSTVLNNYFSHRVSFTTIRLNQHINVWVATNSLISNAILKASLHRLTSQCMPVSL